METSSMRPVTRSFDVFFDLHLKKRLRKQSRRLWIETPSHSLWRRCNVQYFGMEVTRVHSVTWLIKAAIRWRHNGHGSVSNHQPHDCLLNRLFRRRSKKTWKLRVTGLCARNSPGTGEFPAQMASNAENVSIWWRHHEKIYLIVWYDIKCASQLISVEPWTLYVSRCLHLTLSED